MLNDDGAEPTVVDDAVALTVRQMALVDRILGLEAEVARLNATVPVASGAWDEIARLQSQLEAVYASRTWAIGSRVVKCIPSGWRSRSR